MLSDTKKRWVLFSGLTSFFLSIAMLYQMSPFFQAYAQETANVDPGTVGIIFAVLPFSAFIASLPTARLINSYGTRIVLAGGLLGLAFSSLMFGLSDSTMSWIFWRAIQGLSTAPIYSSVAVMFATTFHGPGEFSRVNGIQEAVANMGFAVGPAMGGALFQYGGFFLPFAVSAAGHLLFVGLSCWTPSEEECADPEDDKEEPLLEGDEGEAEIESVSLLNIITPEIVLLVPAGMIFCGVFGALDPVYAKHLGSTLDESSATVLGIVMSLPAIPSVVLALVVPYLMDKFTGHTVMTFGVGLVTIFCFIMALSDPDSYEFLGWGLPLEPGSTAQWILQVTVAVGLGCASALGWTPVLPDMMEKAAGRVARDRQLSREASTQAASAAVSSLFSMCTALGEACGPIGGGMLIKRFGFGGAFVMLGSLFFVYFIVLAIAPWTAIPVYPHDGRALLPAKLLHSTVHLTPVRGKRTPRAVPRMVKTKTFGDIEYTPSRAVSV